MLPLWWSSAPRRHAPVPSRPRQPLLLERLEDRLTPAQYSQLRIVDYNVMNVPDTAALSTVLQAIGTTTRAGLARPIDVLLLQEVNSQAVETQQVLNLFNTLYGAGVYARGTLDQSQSAGGDRQGIIYRVASVDLIAEVEVTGGTGPRAPMRYQLRPDGLDSSYDFYIYNSHYDAVDVPDRLTEAQAIRANADALGQGNEILYAGDYNIDSSTEGMYTTLLAAGNGQAFDPINTPGTWHQSSALRITHTQAPGTTYISGGLDDRFDFILHTQEVGASGTPGDNLGLEYRAGSYWAFANNASHAVNGNITDGNGAPANVLTALTLASDHLPLVSDYDVLIPDTVTVAFTAAAQSGPENGAALIVTAQLSQTSSQTVTIPFTVTGTAANGTDYTITASPITITAGLLTGTVTITPVNDTLDEPNETVVVTMGTPTNATLGATTVHTATLTDDDPTPTVTFTTASQSGPENVGTLTVTAQLSAVSGQTVTLPFTVTGTATGGGTDYTITASPITIPAGQLSANITITVINDALPESNETVIVTMGTPTNAAPGATTVHTATITDNDTAAVTVSFTTTGGSAGENVATRTATVTLSAASAQTVTVPYTLSGTAANPADYTLSPPSPLTFAPGVTSIPVVITVVDDAAAEPNETATLTLGTPTNATLGTTTAYTETIIDNDSGTTFRVLTYTPTQSGFRVTLNSPPTLANLNAYDLAGTPAVEAADVAVTLGGVPVAGSLVRDLADATNQTWTWIATGGTTGVLAPGTYNITLRSDAANGWANTTLGALDGDTNGTAGGDYTNTFVVSTDRSVNIGNFVLGPGQPAAGDPNYATFQVPITVSNQNGINGIAFDLVYDPTLLTLFSGGAGGGTGLVITPAGAAVGFGLGLSILNPTFNTANPRAFVARFGFSPGAPIATSGTLTFATFQVAVPASAANQYAEKQILRMINLGINEGVIPARGDDAIHVNAYQGDASGNGSLSPTDAGLVVQVFGVANSTFDAYQLLDPVLLADASANGSLSPSDAGLVVQEFGNPNATTLPNVPTSGVGTITPSGPDPALYVGAGLTVSPGGSVTVPIFMDVSERTGFSTNGFSLVVSFDNRRFDASALATATAAQLAGSLLGSGWALRAFVYNADGTDARLPAHEGRLVIAAYAAQSQFFAYATVGELIRFTLQARPDAPAGRTIINLRHNNAGVGAQTTEINEGRVVLRPAPTNAANDIGINPRTGERLVIDNAVQIRGGRDSIERGAEFLAAALPQGGPRSLPWAEVVRALADHGRGSGAAVNAWADADTPDFADFLDDLTPTPRRQQANDGLTHALGVFGLADFDR